MIYTGKLTERVTIERDNGASNSTYGEHTEDWQDLHVDLPAEVDTGTTRKFYATKQVEQTMTHLVTVRLLNTLALTDKLRLKWGTRTLNLLGPPIDHTHRTQEYEFHCIEHIG